MTGIQYDWCPYKKEETWTQTDMHTEGMPREKKDGDWGEATTSQGLPKIASKPPEAGERQETDSPSWPSEGTNSANILTLKFSL